MALREGWTIPEVIRLVKRARNDVIIIIGDIDETNKKVIDELCRRLGKYVLFGEEYVSKFEITEKFETEEFQKPSGKCDVAIMYEDTPPPNVDMLVDVPVDSETAEEVMKRLDDYFKSVREFERGIKAKLYVVVDEDRLKVYASRAHRNDEDVIKFCVEVLEETVRKRKELKKNRVKIFLAVVAVATLAAVLVVLHVPFSLSSPR